MAIGTDPNFNMHVHAAFLPFISNNNSALKVSKETYRKHTVLVDIFLTQGNFSGQSCCKGIFMKGILIIIRQWLLPEKQKKSYGAYYITGKCNSIWDNSNFKCVFSKFALSPFAQYYSKI
ncbi:MAG: hypothetical protein AB2693_13380 [Candidatus Thiodiazotropha sp.]